MNDKEILAELKISWENLNDIIENVNLNKDLKLSICNSMDEIAKVYSDIRENLTDKEVQVIINKTEYFIGNSINEDYSERYDEVNNYWLCETCGDLNYYWYKDNKFLQK